jgi:hypothetical protein
LALDRDGASREGGVQPPSEAEFRSRGRPTLERDRTSLEGATDPRARRNCTGATSYPSSGAEFRPKVAGPVVCRAVGPWVYFVRVFRLVCVYFFYEFKRVPPGCLGDPHGCPRHHYPMGVPDTHGHHPIHLQSHRIVQYECCLTILWHPLMNFSHSTGLSLMLDHSCSCYRWWSVIPCSCCSC